MMNGVFEVELAETISERERRLSLDGFCELAGIDLQRDFYCWEGVLKKANHWFLTNQITLERGYMDDSGNWWVYSEKGIVRQ